MSERFTLVSFNLKVTAPTSWDDKKGQVMWLSTYHTVKDAMRDLEKQLQAQDSEMRLESNS